MDASEEQFDADIVDDEMEETGTAIKRLRERLVRTVKEKQEYLEGWQRSRADFANYKREEVRVQSDREVRLKTDFVETLIPTLDSFELAFQDPSYESATGQWKKGIEAVYAGLRKSLESLDIKRHWPEGEKFDPYTHEAVREVPTDLENEDHQIVQVERAGYSLGERIIRPAQVTVKIYQKNYKE